MMAGDDTSLIAVAGLYGEAIPARPHHRKVPAMREAGWYIVQVMAGSEHKMCEAIELACKGAETHDGSPLLEECFTPTYVFRLKRNGEWVDVAKNLLPGYVVAVTTDPSALVYRLKRLREFSRLLSMAETFVPLRKDERAWLEESTKPAERIVPVSIAYREGDRLVVTEGPLKGREGMVKRVIRKKCLAQIELLVDGKRIATTVGLAVMPKQDALTEAAALGGSGLVRE